MKNSYLLVLALFALLFFSCQDETETTSLNAENTFTKNSPISPLIKRVSQYETTADNILDGTSNCSIKLPVQLTVNYQNVTIQSESDFQTVQNIQNQSNTDDDKVHFSYPITIVYPNYEQYSISSESQLENILASYGDDSTYRDINCIDFNYPVSINIYNTNNQVASSVSIQNDSQFYNFIEDIDDEEIVGISFPITLTKTTGGSVIINNNSDLETVINNAIEDCTTPGTNPLVLSNVLTNGTWYVSYFYGDYSDQTYYFNGYNFSYNVNGECTAIKNSTTIYGDWDIHNENNYQKLDFHFDGDILDELEEDWKVLEFTATSIRLKHESDGGSDNHYLNFTKN